MTDNEFTNALECCVRYKQICPETCPMANVRQCKVDLRKSTLDLFNRQKAEIDRLNIELKAMRGAANSYKAEVERLKAENKTLENVIKNTFLLKAGLNIDPFAEIKVEAYKEFAEKAVIELAKNYTADYCHWIDDTIYNLLKEMVGDG